MLSISIVPEISCLGEPIMIVVQCYGDKPAPLPYRGPTQSCALTALLGVSDQ